MQLAAGYIETDNGQYSGFLPALSTCLGNGLEDVQVRLEQAAKDYYGDDVIVELMPDNAAAIY